VSDEARPTVFISDVSHAVLFFGIHALENLLDTKEGRKALTETAHRNGIMGRSLPPRSSLMVSSVPSRSPAT